MRHCATVLPVANCEYHFAVDPHSGALGLMSWEDVPGFLHALARAMHPEFRLFTAPAGARFSSSDVIELNLLSLAPQEEVNPACIDWTPQERLVLGINLD